MALYFQLQANMLPSISMAGINAYDVVTCMIGSATLRSRRDVNDEIGSMKQHHGGIIRQSASGGSINSNIKTQHQHRGSGKLAA